ncbi:MAG: hypothetical protein QF903_04380 [Planctomycetota bacterium]|jgi:hypothetical protein|nr:hypothetical protein [Planctomycetota bacterium]MDP6764346.1 hypothetical protein [Planctomycetota bacterium]MDP6988694.1 hypothetical protein [Planctomycetota bacterium]
MARALALLIALVVGARQPDPGGGADRRVVAHWTFTAEHHADGAFQPVAGGWALPASEPAFLGEGDAQVLLLPLAPGLMAVGEPVAAESLPREDFSVEAWVALDTQPAWGGIFSAIEDNGSAETGLLLGSRNNRFCVAVASEGTDDADGLLTYLTSATTFALGRWYHVVGTYDGARLRLFVDGELQGESSAQSGAVRYSPTHTVAVAAYKDRNEDYRLSGALREVVLLDEALHPKEVRRRYRALADDLPEPAGGTFNDFPEAEHASLAALRAPINRAIDEGVEYLLRRQQRDGSWDYRLSTYPNGGTSLALYTLQKCGLRPDHPSIERGLQFLARRSPRKTYSAGCQLLALGATGDPAHADWAREIVDLLMSWESGNQRGGWAYPGGAVDLSNTQFAALGFWGASQLGVEVPAKLWRRIVDKVAEKHQSFVEEVDWPEEAGPRTGRRRIAGYHYYEDRGPWHDSGTMTTAGLCTLGIPLLLLEDDLGGRTLRQIKRSSELAMGWLETYYEDMWKERRHPEQEHYAGILGDNFYYYLYGVERVGAFFDTELIGEHPWYRDGAERLLAKRSESGDWEGNPKDTCFALLFLRRASAPAQTGQAADRSEAVFADESGEVHVRATGTGRITLWIEGFDEGVLAEYEGSGRAWRGLRVVNVEMLADGESLAPVEGDPLAPYAGERYAVRHAFDLPGEHTFQVRVTVVAPDGDPEHADRVEVLTSAVLAVVTRDSPEEWMAANLALAGADLLAPARPLAKASSQAAGNGPERACDPLHATRWVAAPDDPAPWIRFELARAVRADRVVLAQADSTLALRGHHGAIARLSLSVNGAEPIEVDMGPDPLRQVAVDLDRAQRVRSLEITVLDSTPGANVRGVGFTGIELHRRP